MNGHALFVGAVGGHGVKRINGGENPRGQIQLLGGDAVRITAAVQPFVVTAGDAGNGRGKAIPEQQGAVHRVTPHSSVLRLGQKARFVEDFTGEVAFAHVVIERGEQQVVQIVRVQADAATDRLGKAHDAAGVTEGVVILAFNLPVEVVEVVDEIDEFAENRL